MEHLKYWLGNLIESLEKSDAGSSGERVLIECGRACAALDAVREASAVRDELDDPSDIEALLDALNRRGVGGGFLRQEGDSIVGTYEKCYCPIRTEGFVDSPFFCTCTRGWTMAVFEAALGRPVAVELVTAIGRGDEVCKFVVRPQ